MRRNKQRAIDLHLTDNSLKLASHRRNAHRAEIVTLVQTIEVEQVLDHRLGFGKWHRFIPRELFISITPPRDSETFSSNHGRHYRTQAIGLTCTEAHFSCLGWLNPLDGFAGNKVDLWDQPNAMDSHLEITGSRHSLWYHRDEG
jgi:hypothetical protein